MFVLHENGFKILENSINRETIDVLLEDLSRLAINKRNRGIYGIRNLLNLSPKVREFSQSEAVREIVEKYLGVDAQLVRAIYFDKTPDANWKVPWHQDLTIAVREKVETQGFRTWTIKDNVPHVQPPIRILEGMLTLRFHLDDADETNGGLRIIPKSHEFGRLNATEIGELKSKNEAIFCPVNRGDCFLMKPLIVHSSSAGSQPQHRRVVHFEFSAEKLPNGLEFYGA